MKKFFKLLSALVFVFAVGLAGYTFVDAGSAGDGTIPNTVYIGDIDVSGMTADEAQQALDRYVSTLKNQTFSLTTGDKSIQVTAEDIGLHVSNEDVVEEALNLGKTGNLIARYKDKKDLEKEPKKFQLTYGADETKMI